MAEYTSKLNLYKVDPATDGDNTFNIETMMNNNWDKIDDKVSSMDDTLNNVDDLLKVSATEPTTYNSNTLWMQDVGDSDFSSGGGINIANALTSAQPPTDNSYWFEPI